MENASKALLMAGGILIAILIVSIAVYMFATYSKVGTSYGDTMDSNEKIKFNTNFTKFEGRNDINAQEIVSLVNFVKNYKETSQIEITIKAPGLNENELIDFIRNNSSKKFKCEYIGFDSNGIVDEIRFQYL